MEENNYKMFWPVIIKYKQKQMNYPMSALIN